MFDVNVVLLIFRGLYHRLDQELDFILSQQKELEDLLGPLEESVKEQSGTIYMQNADEERERT